MDNAQEITFRTVDARDAYLKARGYTEKGQEENHPGGWPGAKFRADPDTGDKWYVDGRLIYKL